MPRMVKHNITCSTDSSPMSREQLENVLHQQGISLDTEEQQLLDLVASRQMVCEALCYTKDDPKGGPFLLVVRVSLQNKAKYRALLTKLTGDKTLAVLFDPPGPAYVRVLRCRPAVWKALKECCVKSLSSGKRSKSSSRPAQSG